MRSWYRCGLRVLACGMFFAAISAARANDSESFDGPSRQQLFETRLAAELGPEGALAAAAAPPFFLPSDVKGNSIFGVDVSHHNDENCRCKPGEACKECKIDWSRAHTQKLSFVYLKASQGTRYRDPTFEYHWRTLAQHNIARGAYHFMSADEDPIEQADNFVDKLEASGAALPTDLPPCLDLESDLRKDRAKRWLVSLETGQIRDFWSDQEPDEILQKVLKWLKRVEERTGRVPVIYTSRGWWNDRIKDEKKFAQFARYPIWIANYPGSGSPLNAQPKVPNGQTWTLWQFTETGRMQDADVVPGRLDINKFNASLGSLHQVLGASVTEVKTSVRREEPKNVATPMPQVTEGNSTAARDSIKSAQQVAIIVPRIVTDTNEPAVTENNSSAPAKFEPPAQTTAPTSTTAPADTGKTDQKAAAVPPSTASSEGAPAQSASVNQSNAPPNSASQTPPANASGQAPPNAGPPVQQAAASSSNEPAKDNAPPQQVAAVMPNNAEGAGKPAEQIMSPSIAPGKSEEAGINPGDAQQNSPAASPRTGSAVRRTAARNAAQRTAADNSQKTAAENTPSPAGEKTMVEIVLTNGRVIRVDANIDPAILSRLIAAVEGN
jgi:lysozyme